MSGFEGPGPDTGWAAFQAARDRFFARVRPQSVRGPAGADGREAGGRLPAVASSGRPAQDPVATVTTPAATAARPRA